MKGSGINKRAGHRGLIALSIPTLLWYIAFCYLPMFGIVIAFKRYRPVPGKNFIYNLFAASPWVGGQNFRFLFLNPQMLSVIRNTLAYNLAFFVLDTILPVALAILLSYLYSSKLRNFAQTTMMLPHFMSWVVVSYFLYAFLSTDRGIINNIIISGGQEAVRWYQEPSAWPVILMITHTWKAYGYATVMHTAYIMSIDPTLYDSAMIDGASVRQVIVNITLPLLRPIILVLLILNLGGILNTDFGLFYQATRNSGSILSVTETIDIYVYKALMEQANYGYSAAASLLQNGIGCLFLLAANLIIKKIAPEEGVL